MGNPVLVGPVPLLAVTSFVLTEGYKTAAIAGSSLVQMVSPSAKTINIEALLMEEQRALRPALEALALTSRALAAAVAPLMKIAGIPVVAKNGVHLDMQITQLVFTQDNQMRNTLRVTIGLTYVPRSKASVIAGAIADVAVAAGTPFL